MKPKSQRYLFYLKFLDFRIFGFWGLPFRFTGHWGHACF